MGCGSCFGKKEPRHYEPPQAIEPPKRRKTLFFEPSYYSKIDKHASTVSLRYLKKNLSKLINHLSKPVDDGDDLGMLRSLFIWLTRLKLDDILERGITDGAIPKPDSPLFFLSNLKASLINHANFFKMLCTHANIPCEVITGMNKNATYKIGHRLNKERLKAQWNAVYVCGEWRFIDIHWASLSVTYSRSTDWVVVNMKESESDAQEIPETLEDSEIEVFNDFFFLTDPDMFICTHFPYDPQWQLLPQPVPLDRFQGSVYVREKYFTLDLSVSDITKMQCVLQTVDGLLEVGFGIPEERSSEAAFRFLFYNYKQEFQFDAGFTLEHYVLNQQSIDSVSFTLRFPKTGTYKFDIFGRENPRGLFDLVCSYVIQCSEPRSKCLPLPFIPNAGWGPTTACHQMGITPLTHKFPVIKTADGICDIKFSINQTIWMKFQVTSTGVEDWLLDNSVLAWREEDNIFLQTRFREEGEYALKIVAADVLNLGKAQNICNYLVTVQKSSNLTEFPLLRGCLLGPTDLAQNFEVKPDSHKSAIIRTSDRNIILTMTMAEKVEILAEITNNEIDNMVICSNASWAVPQGKVVFNIDLPSKEEFGINVYARKQGERHSVYHVYTYYVVVEPNSQSNSQKSLHDNLDSPLSSSKAMSDATSSHPSEDMSLSEIVIPVSAATAKKYIIVRLVTRLKPMYCELRFDEITSYAFKEVAISSQSRDSSTLYTVGLPHLGKYTLNIFEEIYPGFLAMFASFKIHRCESVTQEIGEVSQTRSADEKKQQLLSMKREEQAVFLKRALRIGLRTKNVQLLKQTLKQMRDLQIEDDEEQLMDKAKEMLKWLKIRDELTKAMSRKDRKQIEYLLDSVTNNNMVSHIVVEVAAAKRLLEYLKRLDRLKSLRQQRIDVMNLDTQTMAEIRSYLHPPVPVYLVLMATCILLGEDSDDLLDWSKVKKIISQSGKMSLQHRVFHYNIDGLTIEMTREAKSILQDLTLDDIANVSPAAATFYMWVLGTAEEAEIRSGKQGSDITPASKSKNHHVIVNIVNQYFASKGGKNTKDEFDNIDGAFVQNPKQPQASPQSRSSTIESFERKSPLSPTPHLSFAKESSSDGPDRLEQVKSVWDTLDDD